jgi:predicted RecB family nuclease
MARAVWSFLHEWAIYEYLMTRFDEGTLRFKAVRKSRKYVGREKWIKVTRLPQIKDSRFPDVKSITLASDPSVRCAEVTNCHWCNNCYNPLSRCRTCSPVAKVGDLA